MFPAETTASASPSPTARTARTSDESGFRRTTSAGLSSISTVSVVTTCGKAMRVEVGRAEDDGLDALIRRGDGACDDLVRGMVAPEGVHGDPAAHCLRCGSSERLNVAAPVRLARGAGVMGARRGAAVRAHVDGRHGDAVLSAALVAAGLGCLSLGDCHERPQSVAEHASGRAPRWGILVVRSTNHQSASSRVGSIASRKVRSCVTTTSVPS